MLPEPKDPETLDIPRSNEPRISDEILCKLLDDHSEFDDFIIIDCRSEREYKGGHIKGAIRCHPYEKQKNVENLYQKIWKPRSIYIFHCEYSQFRGPMAWDQFHMEHQFSHNYASPLHAFVLHGGYRKFYALHPEYCDGKYIPEDPNKTFDD